MKHSYLIWHYGIALRALIHAGAVYTRFVYHYFSISLLTTSLFDPWHRESVEIGDFFPLGRYFEQLGFNLISRGIGAIIRFTTIIVGCIATIITYAISLCMVICWLLIPGITFPLYLLYDRKSLVEHLTWEPHTMKEAFLHLCVGMQAKFIFSRLGLSLQSAIREAKTWHDAGLPDVFATVQTEKEAFNLIADHWMPLKNWLEKQNIHVQDIKNLANWYERIYKETNISTLFDEDTLMRTPGFGSNWLYGYTFQLGKFTYPVSSQQNPFGPLHAHNKYLHGMENILKKMSQNNILIVGDPGSGRHALIERLADTMKEGKIIPSLRYLQVLMLSMDQLISEAKENKDIPETVTEILKEAEHAGNCILVVDHMDQYVCHDATPDLTNVFAQFLERGKVHIIGITTPEEFHRCLKPNTTIMNTMSPLILDVPDKDEMRVVLEDAIGRYEWKYRLFFPYRTIVEIETAATHLLPATPFPQKFIDALNMIVATIPERTDRTQIVVVTPQMVDDAMSAVTHIPFGAINHLEKKKLLDLEHLLHQRVIGQNEALVTIAAALRRRKADIESDTKPIGSFLFLGPTGVGKTETAKALASIYFEQEDRLIRLDMEQYKTEDSISQLIGSPTAGEPGKLRTLINDHPYSVLLLDEFEKAHPAILNLFLPVLDEGYLTDAFGKKIFFNHTIIIATSNAGAEYIRSQTNSDKKPNKKQLIDYILDKGFFTPELVNRFDSIVNFSPLDMPTLRLIAQMKLTAINKKLRKHKNISIQITDDLIDEIARLGCDAEFGARAMQRVIQEKIEDIIAKKILSDSVRKNEIIQFPVPI